MRFAHIDSRCRLPFQNGFPQARNAGKIA